MYMILVSLESLLSSVFWIVFFFNSIFFVVIFLLQFYIHGMYDSNFLKHLLEYAYVSICKVCLYVYVHVYEFQGQRKDTLVPLFEQFE